MNARVLTNGIEVLNFFQFCEKAKVKKGNNNKFVEICLRVTFTDIQLRKQEQIYSEFNFFFSLSPWQSAKNMV